MALAATELDAERSDLLAVLAKHRQFLRYTARDLTDEQARARTTASELTVGGLIKHVTAVERQWGQFLLVGPSALGDASAMSPADWAAWADGFRLLDDETLAGALDEYEAVAATTDELVRTLPDLNATQPLPVAPWYPPSERWSARQVLLHVIAETAQHSGHADIIRESLDGQKTMG